MNINIRPPQNASEFDAYFLLRYNVLRKPWGFEKGSEISDDENIAFHFAAFYRDKIIGVCRLHNSDVNTMQLRYMAVDESCRGMKIGQILLKYAEQFAREKGVCKIILEARENAVLFYKKNGYLLIRPSKILWGIIPHFLMEKQL